MTNLDVLWNDEATGDEIADAYQNLIDSGQAWRLEGSIGRAAMDHLEAGLCVLGETGHRDYYGNYVPSRTEVEPGSKGSVQYAAERCPERWGE